MLISKLIRCKSCDHEGPSVVSKIYLLLALMSLVVGAGSLFIELVVPKNQSDLSIMLGAESPFLISGIIGIFSFFGLNKSRRGHNCSVCGGEFHRDLK